MGGGRCAAIDLQMSSGARLALAVHAVPSPGGIVQWGIVVKDGTIVEVTEVVGVEGSRVLFERYRPPRDTVLKTVSRGGTMIVIVRFT